MGAAKGEGAAGATPLSAAPDLVTSSSATDWPVELDGGPGGSDAAGALRRCKDRLAGSDSGSDAESSRWVCTLICTWWEIICRSKLARSGETRKLGLRHLGLPPGGGATLRTLTHLGGGSDPLAFSSTLWGGGSD